MSFTSDGHLVIKGRKKEMIVTPEGMKVFPEDVEAVLGRIPGVRDSAIIGEDRVHAVLVPDAGADTAAIVRRANEHLEDHQKIRSFSIWTAGDLPRTASTGKLRRKEIAEAVIKGAIAPTLAPGEEVASPVQRLLQRYAPGRAIHSDTSLDELGLSSLDRVELMIDLEEKLGTSINEGVFASTRTVGELEGPMPSAAPAEFPAWNRRADRLHAAAIDPRFHPVAINQGYRRQNDYIRSGESHLPARTGDFRGKSPELSRHACHPWKPSGALEISYRPRHVERILRGLLSSGPALSRGNGG